MTDCFEFTVRGIPVPQGSGRSFVSAGKARHVTTSAPLLDWRGRIATAAQAALAGAPAMTGTIAVALHFRPSERPASHYLPANSRRPVRELRPDAPGWHASTPDLDKCIRAALDALSGIAFADDRQVARITATSSWPEPGEAPGVDVRVRRLEETR